MDYCPRKIEDHGNPETSTLIYVNKYDVWRENGTCSYCGSMNPDTLMEALEAGTVTIGATDKSYKIYVDGSKKFYFQHFSEAQMKRFIELFNERRIRFSGGIGFYVFPYFFMKK